MKTRKNQVKTVRGNLTFPQQQSNMKHSTQIPILMLICCPLLFFFVLFICHFDHLHNYIAIRFTLTYISDGLLLKKVVAVEFPVSTPTSVHWSSGAHIWPPFLRKLKRSSTWFRMRIDSVVKVMGFYSDT